MSKETFKTKGGAYMEVSDAMLEKLEKLAAVHFTPEQVADYFEADREWMQITISGNLKHPISITFLRACMESEFKIRTAVFDLANRNSAAAQEMAKTYIDQQKIAMA